MISADQRCYVLTRLAMQSVTHARAEHIELTAVLATIQLVDKG